MTKRPDQVDLLDAALCRAFGANVLRLRKEHDMTQTQLASASHLSRGLISEVENGTHRNVTLSTARRIASAMGTTIHAMLT